MKPQSQMIKDLLENIHQNDLIKKKWIYSFFTERLKDMDSNMSLEEYCKIMERDEKIRKIID